MLTGMLAVRNMTAGERHDLWSVNADQAYHEEIHDTSRGKVAASAEAIEGALVEVFARVDRLALGLSVGTIAALVLFVMTGALVLKGGSVVGPNLQLLSQFFPGYSVTTFGSVVGLGYGFAAGFVMGWSTAFFRNLSVFLSIRLLRSGAERRTLRDIFDYV